jgi:hypothetical protein
VKIEQTDYGAWYKAECTQVCGWPGRTAGLSVTRDAAKGHVREKGHETALIRTSSVHYRKASA